MIGYERAGRLLLCDDAFWATPLTFAEMTSPLREQLASSRVLILKGDLNYRRYVQDRMWPLDSPAARHRVPSLPPALALRVLKSELAVGLSAEVVAKLHAADLYDGKNSIIQQFC